MNVVACDRCGGQHYNDKIETYHFRKGESYTWVPAISSIDLCERCLQRLAETVRDFRSVKELKSVMK